MTSLDFLPRTQSECRLVESIIQSEFGIHPTMQARMAGVQRLARWMESGGERVLSGDRRVFPVDTDKLAKLVVIGGVF